MRLRRIWIFVRLEARMMKVAHHNWRQQLVLSQILSRRVMKLHSQHLPRKKKCQVATRLEIFRNCKCFDFGLVVECIDVVLEVLKIPLMKRAISKLPRRARTCRLKSP